MSSDESNKKLDNKRTKLTLLKNYFTVEPVVACWLLPSLFLIVAMENLGLEKSCIVNLGLDEMVCANMINRSINEIDCSTFESSIIENTVTTNLTELPSIMSVNDASPGLIEINTEDGLRIKFNPNSPIDKVDDFDDLGLKLEDYENDNMTTTNISEKDLYNSSADSQASPLLSDELPFDRVVVGDELKELTRKVCTAETDSQRLIAAINGYRAPIAAIFPIIIILFAGGWSDKKGLRKPCMLFPLIGELLGCIALFISAIFMRQLPMEFGSILERVLPAMMGGQTLMLMGVYSYLSASTAEEDRTFRFAFFAIFITLVQILGIPFSGTLYNTLGYTKLFLLCIIIYIIGILWCLIGIKEVKVKHTDPKFASEMSTNGNINAAFDNDQNDVPKASPDNTAANKTTAANGDRKEKQNFFAEFFDPSLALACVQVFLKPRVKSGRLILFLLIAAYFLSIAPAFGEGDYIYLFSRIKLNWDGVAFSHFSTYNVFSALVGTSLLTGLISKFFKMSDPMIGSIASIGSIISKPIYAFATKPDMFYIAATVDLFVSTRAIAIKSVLSRFVEADELGRVYSVLGIMDAFIGFIIPPIYSIIYIHTAEKFTGAFYLFGEVFMIPTLLVFIFIWLFFRGTSAENKDDKENGMEHVSQTRGDKITSLETTRM